MESGERREDSLELRVLSPLRYESGKAERRVMLCANDIFAAGKQADEFRRDGTADECQDGDEGNGEPDGNRRLGHAVSSSDDIFSFSVLIFFITLLFCFLITFYPHFQFLCQSLQVRISCKTTGPLSTGLSVIPFPLFFPGAKIRVLFQLSVIYNSALLILFFLFLQYCRPSRRHTTRPTAQTFTHWHILKSHLHIL